MHFLRPAAARRRSPKLPAMLYPMAAERVYAAALLRLVDALWREARPLMVERYADWRSEARAELRADGWYEGVASAISRLFFSTEAAEKAAQAEARKAAEAVGGLSTSRWKAAVRSLTGLDIFRTENWLLPLIDQWSSENSKLISSIRREFLDKVSARTVDAVRQGLSLRDYSAELRRTYALTRDRANLIARTEVAKLNSAITEGRQTRLGIREYVWRDASDERVRPSHRALDGKICRWDDSSVYRNEDETFWRKRSGIGGYEGKPGTAYRCRCIGEPRVESVIDALLEGIN